MALDQRACHGRLRDAEVAFSVVHRRQAPSVEQPVRLEGPLAGVLWKIPWSRDAVSDPHGVWDCRLVLAMVPISSWLSAQGMMEVHYFSAYRAPNKRDIARRKPRSQHHVGLAVDVLGVIPRGARSGSVMRSDVETDYPRGVLGQCPAPPGLQGRSGLWLELVCQLWTTGLLHTVLTPDYDHDHRNHLHLDLKRGQGHPADPFVSFAGPSQ
jgi:hypothetical protein